jgi:hypothetical protein
MQVSDFDDSKEVRITLKIASKALSENHSKEIGSSSVADIYACLVRDMKFVHH